MFWFTVFGYRVVLVQFVLRFWDFVFFFFGGGG